LAVPVAVGGLTSPLAEGVGVGVGVLVGVAEGVGVGVGEAVGVLVGVGEGVGVGVTVGVGVGVGVATTGTPGTTTVLAAQRCSTVAPRVPVTRAERYLPASADVIV
jgi:hypothetical protein